MPLRARRGMIPWPQPILSLIPTDENTVSDEPYAALRLSAVSASPPRIRRG